MAYLHGESGQCMRLQAGLCNGTKLNLYSEYRPIGTWLMVVVGDDDDDDGGSWW